MGVGGTTALLLVEGSKTGRRFRRWRKQRLARGEAGAAAAHGKYESVVGSPGRDFAEHIPRLRRYARALTGDRGRADDLVQDTLERALAKFHLWRPGSDLRAWMFTIMHNVFINQMRAGASVTVSALDDESIQPAIRATQSDRLEVLDLQNALARLPEEQRAVLLLVGLEQMTYEETARVLDVPIGTVMSRLSRARERLRALLNSDAKQASGLKVVK
jgi:RNA polymerase sigma-70 factor (ECF subfamily)